MKNLIFIFLLFFCLFTPQNSLMGAEEGYITNKSDDGSVIILDDGSVWRVSPTDQIDSRLWLPGDTIIVPDNEDSLINSDDGEKVDADRIR